MPYEFPNTKELGKALSKANTEIGEWFTQRKSSLDEIVHHSVGSNTFRAFQKLPERPSIAFRAWALRECNNSKAIRRLQALRSQESYDKWIKDFCGSLSRTWNQKMGEAMPYGPSRKLPNLLLKELVLWSGLSDAQRKRVIGFLHVPLDSYTLVALRNCIDGLRIPKTARMGFVTGEPMYDQIQATIRTIASKANVPAIYFDNLAWNLSH